MNCYQSDARIITGIDHSTVWTGTVFAWATSVREARPKLLDRVRERCEYDDRIEPMAQLTGRITRVAEEDLCDECHEDVEAHARHRHLVPV